MAHRLGIVAVGIEDEGRVIIGVILGSQPRRSIIGAAGLERCSIEDVDRGAGLRNEGNMHRPARGLALPNSDRTEADGGLPLVSFVETRMTMP